MTTTGHDRRLDSRGKLGTPVRLTHDGTQAGRR